MTRSCCGRATQTLELEDRERLGLPVFVKPARGGSSIGVSRVTAWDQLPAAIALARRHDPKVIVEAAVPGRELECGVLEFPDGRVEASTVGEIRVAGVRGREDAFYDFATKYLEDAAELDVPAKVDDEIAACRCGSWRSAPSAPSTARAWPASTSSSPTHGPVINEINTMPGFTTISMYPRMWAASGDRLSDAVGDDGGHGAGAGHRPALAGPDPGSTGMAGHRLRDRRRDQLDRRGPEPSGSVSAT